MKFDNYNDSMIGKWVFIRPKIKNSAFEELFKDHSSNLIAAYLYIDHTAGISLQIEYFLNRSFWGKFKNVLNAKESGEFIVLRYDTFSSFEFCKSPEEITSELILNQPPDWVKTYQRPDLQLFRNTATLNPFRCPGFPDDIAVIIIAPEGLHHEQVWARVESFNSEEFSLHATLLNEPNQALGPKLGDLLNIIPYELEPGNIRLVAINSK